MTKLGLALSGGGFRATLYHLGLLRFLRDASILPRVTHVTSVSGGSIMAAHLALNWDRYTGEATEFDAAAAEVLAFARLDVRNRIIRRFPLTLPLRWPRRLLGRSNRRLTRTGLLEYPGLDCGGRRPPRRTGRSGGWACRRWPAAGGRGGSGRGGRSARR
jgi:predicted acylesterase/phospholipase RssA